MISVLVLKILHSELSPGVLGVCDLPRSVDKVVCVRPVGQQVGGLHIVHSDVHVSEGFWEKIVNFPCDVQNVADAEKQTRGRLRAM